MPTNIYCRISRQCSTLTRLVVSRNFSQILINHGKPVPNYVFQKWIRTSRQLHEGVPALKNVKDPSSTLPDLSLPKSLRNNNDAKTIVKKLMNTSPENYSDDIITSIHFCLALGADMRTSNKIFKKHPELRNMTLRELTERIRILKERGISEDRIKISAWLLLKPYEELQALAEYVARILNVPFRCAIPLTNIPMVILRIKIASRWKKEVKELEEFKDSKFSNRMEYLADRLKLTTEDIAFMISRNVIIGERSLHVLKPVIQILEEVGVRSEDIYNDPYVLATRESLMLPRLKIIREQKIKNVKPWMFRESESDLMERATKQRRELDLLSGHSDIRSFLQNELNCTYSDVDQIVSKICNFNTLKASKIRKTIKFLASKGYPNEHILESPWVLTHSLDTIEFRYKQLVEKGIRGFKISTLCLSSRAYKQLLSRFESTDDEAEEGASSS